MKKKLNLSKLSKQDLTSIKGGAVFNDCCCSCACNCAAYDDSIIASGQGLRDGHCRTYSGNNPSLPPCK